MATSSVSSEASGGRRIRSLAAHGFRSQKVWRSDSPRRAHAYSVYLLLTGPPVSSGAPRTFPRSVNWKANLLPFGPRTSAQQHICTSRPAMDWLDAGVWMGDSRMERALEGPVLRWSRQAPVTRAAITIPQT